MILSLFTMIVALLVGTIWRLGILPAARLLQALGINSFLFISGIFARTTEVYLHHRFGQRYLLHPSGWLTPFFALLWTLLLGLLLRVPSLIVEQVGSWQETKAAVRRTLALEWERAKDPNAETTIVRGLMWLVDTVSGAIDHLAEGYTPPSQSEEPYQLPNVHPTDSIIRGVWKLCRAIATAMININSPPLVYFAVASFLLMILHAIFASHTMAEDASGEAGTTRYSGRPYLADLCPWWSEATIKRFVEPLFVIGVGFIMWGRPPGSALTLPSAFVDPFLGHFLQFAGVGLLIDANFWWWRNRMLPAMEQTDQQRRVEQQFEDHQPQGADGNLSRSSHEPARVETVSSPTVSSSGVDAMYEQLPPNLKELLDERPDRPKESPKLIRWQCPHCKKRLTGKRSMVGQKYACIHCGHRARLLHVHRER